MLKIYPEWDEIKDELNKDDLLEIIDNNDKNITLKEAIDNFIEENYYPQIQRDIDFEYKSKIEDAIA